MVKNITLKLVLVLTLNNQFLASVLQEQKTVSIVPKYLTLMHNPLVQSHTIQQCLNSIKRSNNNIIYSARLLKAITLPP